MVFLRSFPFSSHSRVTRHPHATFCASAPPHPTPHADTMASGGGGASLQTKCCFPGCDHMLPYGEGHNAEPLRKGRCCDDCHEKVLKARVADRSADAMLSSIPNGNLQAIQILPLGLVLTFHEVGSVYFFFPGGVCPPELRKELGEMTSRDEAVSIYKLLRGLNFDFLLFQDGQFTHEYLKRTTFTGVALEMARDLCAREHDGLMRVSRLKRRHLGLNSAMPPEEFYAQLESTEQREKERRAQAEADEAYLAEERAKATAEKKAHKEAMELKEKQGTSTYHVTLPFMSSPHLTLIYPPHLISPYRG